MCADNAHSGGKVLRERSEQNATQRLDAPGRTAYYHKLSMHLRISPHVRKGLFTAPARTIGSGR